MSVSAGSSTTPDMPLATLGALHTGHSIIASPFKAGDTLIGESIRYFSIVVVVKDYMFSGNGSASITSGISSGGLTADGLSISSNALIFLSSSIRIAI